MPKYSILIACVLGLGARIQSHFFHVFRFIYFGAFLKVFCVVWPFFDEKRAHMGPGPGKISLFEASFFLYVLKRIPHIYLSH